MARLGGWLAGLAGGTWLLFSGRAVGALDQAPAPPGQHPLRPPGALPEPSFTEACIGCYLCAEVCPPRCIVFPSSVRSAQPIRGRVPGTTVDLEIDPPEWRRPATPWILPWNVACTLCLRCTEVCPTGALRLVPPAAALDPDRIGMGVAKVDRKTCLPWTRRSWCGACHTVCPARNRAITVDYQNRPTVHAEFCVGCGLCVEVCPLRTKAIAVLPPFEPDRGHVRVE
jgi:ferredoxin